MRLLLAVLASFPLATPAIAQTFLETAAYLLHGLEAGTPGYTRLPEPPLRFINAEGDTQFRFDELSPCMVTVYSDFVYRNEPTAMETRAVDFSRVVDVRQLVGMNIVTLFGNTIASCDRVKAKCENVDWSQWNANVDKDRLMQAKLHMRKLCPPKAF